VQAVEPGGPASQAGLAAGDVISHINGTAVQGLLHVQVVSLILSGGTSVRVQATPLSGTTIKTGHRPRVSSTGGRARASRPGGGGRRHRPSMSLFRRLSSRKAAEQQLAAAGAQLGVPAPVAAAPSHYVRSLSTGADAQQPAPPTSSDSDSSPGSSEHGQPPHARPSSLHGLKNKVMLAAIGSSRSTSSVTSWSTSSVTSSLRRQSFHAVPPSPLARHASPAATTAACPAAISTSPTVARSLSPLVGGHGLLSPLVTA